MIIRTTKRSFSASDSKTILYTSSCSLYDFTYCLIYKNFICFLFLGIATRPIYSDQGYDLDCVVYARPFDEFRVDQPTTNPSSGTSTKPGNSNSSSTNKLS